MPRRALLILTFFGILPTGVWAGSSVDAYLYDARMAFLKAGELALELNRSGESYEVSGEFQTSRAMSTYYSWNGIFAAAGKWSVSGPITTAYMSRTTSKDDDLKIVLNYEDGARLLDGSDAEFETINKPAGIDLISALFFSPTCYQGGEVHDGEDAYRLELRKEKTHQLNGGKRYYQGEVVSCDYSVRDHKNRKRRIIVSLADVGDTKVAVQVRAKIPILPDAVFRLRIPTEALSEQVAAAAK